MIFIKKYILLVFLLVYVVSLVACSNKISSTIVQESNNIDENLDFKYSYFDAEVLEVLDNSILVRPLNEENELISSDKIYVSLDNMELSFDLLVGQIVYIVFDGEIVESYPAQILGTMVISLIEDVPIIMVNGQLYYSTSEESSIEVRCGVMDGNIDSSVEPMEKPTRDNQSNFGVGYEYQYGLEGAIDVLIDGKWIVFEIRDDEELQEEVNLLKDISDWFNLRKEERIMAGY